MSALLCACACAFAFGCSKPATTSGQPAPPPSSSISTAATSAAPAPVPAARAGGIRLTPKLAAACGPDYLERHATSLSDLDGDGTFDRPSMVREGGAVVVRLHQLPSFRERGSWKLPNGYLELATPRRAGSQRGDLWITIGEKLDKPWSGSSAPAAQAWKETLYHLEGGQLVAVTSGYRDMHIRVDVDGDGRVDPIGSDGGAVRALLAGDKWLALPVVLSSHVHGAPLPNEQQAAADLDGNGVRELVIERDKSLAIVEVPSLREVWSIKGKPWKPSLVKWGSALVLVVQLDDKLKIFSTDAKHALIAQYPDAASYAEVPAAIGTQLVISGHPWRFFERASPAKSVGSLDRLVARLDEREQPFGPLRLTAKDAPGLVASSGDAGGPLEIVLVDPKTRAVRRTVWTSEPRAHGSMQDFNVQLVDLDRDGASELLVEEIHRTAFHHGASWNTSRLRILDGSGKLLWEEQGTRTDHWVHEGGGPRGRGTMRQTQVDGTHVRAFDLADGTMPLRVRSARDEYYVLAGSSKLTAIPPCLE